jgi:putative toxin-antitoxin system antitoxin component (TIGR02293 family)
MAGSIPLRRRGDGTRRGVAGGAFGRSIGITADDVLTVVRLVESGLPFSAVGGFQKASGIPLATLASLLRIPPRTLVRRRAAGRLAPEESERLLRLATLFEQAFALFEGDVATAREWLTRPKKALGGETPLRLARTEVGAREVERLIGRLEHGVFS